MADLWVQAAINADNEDVFESDTSEDDEEDDDNYAPDYDVVHRLRSASRRSSRPRHSMSASRRRPSAAGSHRPSTSIARRILSLESGPSRMSSVTHLPAIFSHTGVRTPPSLAADLPSTATSPPAGITTNDLRGLGTTDLRTIAEDRPISTASESVAGAPSISEKPPSAFSELPFPIIIQFGLLALHSTTHDQVFYSYLVS